MAHVVLTVSHFETAVPFYEKLLPFLGMKRVFKGEEFLHHVGGRTALEIRFEQGKPLSFVRGQKTTPGYTSRDTTLGSAK